MSTDRNAALWRMRRRRDGRIATCGIALGLLAMATVLHNVRDRDRSHESRPAVDAASLAAPRDVTVSALETLFGQVGYDLDAVRAGLRGVPRLTLDGVPNDLHDVAHPGDRKATFIAFMLPMILQANERVLEQRRFLEGVSAGLAAGQEPEDGVRARIQAIALEYGVAEDDLPALMERVDIVPPSLAIAQAAIESGWGTSRFVREGNAAYGQQTTSAYDNLIPEARPDGATYRVRAFGSLMESVDSYLRNLNSHAAYADFRKARAALRQAGTDADGTTLAGALEIYSEKGQHYVELVRDIIRRNGLEAFNRARLDTVALPPGSFRVADQRSGT
ncbi:MAG: glucosaminidase domain-containing protein [Alphaproteobacteria bacterium]